MVGLSVCRVSSWKCNAAPLGHKAAKDLIGEFLTAQMSYIHSFVPEFDFD